METSFRFRSDSASAHDYANVALGARSIPGLTSPLYSPPLRLDITRVDRTFWKSFSPRPTIHPPEMALSGDSNPGQCWAFAGYSGQLGIQLPVPVRVTSFIIEHTRDKSFAESAPRNVVLWGLVPSNDIDPPTRNTSSNPLQPQFGASHVSVQLASVVFDAIQGQPRQIFELRHTAARRHFDHLVAQILGNWGHPDYTCLYRLEIHGSESPVSS
ncbi:UNC-like C-terminal-domain-containing protein [Lactarius pseudohatsudake]|nr:UNC-like C-terminal-domain-containing protein [Lactarius pseudohatsudake]